MTCDWRKMGLRVEEGNLWLEEDGLLAREQQTFSTAVKQACSWSRATCSCKSVALWLEESLTDGMSCWGIGPGLWPQMDNPGLFGHMLFEYRQVKRVRGG